MSVYKHTSYKKLLSEWIAAQPGQGRGQKSRIAETLGIQSSMLSQVLGGDKQLSLEQACKLCRYLGYGPEETDYLLDLVQLDRAGSAELRAVLEERLARARSRARGVSKMLKQSRELDERDQARYYSSWHYSAIRVLTEMPECRDPSSIATRLGLPRELVTQALRFLVEAGLCTESGGRFKSAPVVIRPSARSGAMDQHLRNWRLKTIERIGQLGDGELAYSALMAIPPEAEQEVREELLECVRKVLKRMESSHGGELRSFNLDWIRL